MSKSFMRTLSKMSNEIILYDLPSTAKCACWSLNPWKARLALNYKGLPYKTEWVEYPDLKGRFMELGIPANDPSVNPNADYSSPAIYNPKDGKYTMDSLAIAQELEKLQPSPSLHLDSPLISKTQGAIGTVMKSLAPVAMPKIPSMLPSRSAEYFHETRAKRFGMPLPELAKSEKAGESAWEGAKPGFEELVKILHEKEGPYVEGKQPGFADFVLAGYWRFMERLGLDGRVMGFDVAFKKHRDACAKWLERED